MQGKEKRRRYKEALHKFYFPAPPPPPPPTLPLSPPQVDPSVLQVEADGLEEERDEEEGSPTETVARQKLTRAQRKRLRKRKLKEAAAVSAVSPGQRRKIIGPTLPSEGSNPGSVRLESKGFDCPGPLT